MNVNTSTSAYSYVQNNSGNVAKTSSSQPATDSSVTAAQSASSSQATISGQGLMMSRLFGNTTTLPQVQTQLTKNTQDMDASNFLTKSDLNALSDLYAQAQGTDLRYVDDLARDLGNYRKFGSVEGNYNDGKIYDNSGRVQTVEFTEKDAATASRILKSGNLSSSGLDPAFLKYELDPGYSFSHTANFEYLESVVNNTGNNITNQTSQFSSYVSQGQNNYILITASEVTFKTEEPDFISKDGVFTVTETGKKHGFRLEGNDVVQDKNFNVADMQSGAGMTASMLLDYFVSQNKSEESNSDKPATLFDYLFTSESNKNSNNKT